MSGFYNRALPSFSLTIVDLVPNGSGFFGLKDADRPVRTSKVTMSPPGEHIQQGPVGRGLRPVPVLPGNWVSERCAEGWGEAVRQYGPTGVPL